MNEFTKPQQEESVEKKVQEKINEAVKNAMSESHLEELQQEMVLLQNSEDDGRFAREAEIENEIKASSVVADDLVEFEEALMQVASFSGNSEEWAKDTLIHENAHANVSEQTGHEWVGYMIIFTKDEKGVLKSLYPIYFNKTQRHWGAIETLLKSIVVGKAPKVYGNRLSSGDKADIKRDTERLRKMEETNKAEVDRVRGELGL